MRAVWVFGLLFLAGCAAEKLALSPPVGVDLSGQWQLNEADSDDPQHVAQSQNAGSSGSAAANPAGGQDGRGGARGSRGGGRNGLGGFGGGAAGPTMPAVGALTDGLRWPGKELAIRQVGGVVRITSMGTTQVYTPTAAANSQHSDSGNMGGRDTRGRRGERSGPLCGWDDHTLVVKSDGADDNHSPFEQRFSVSAGERLVEVVAFKGGRFGDFTVSRVWDRVMPPPPAQ